MEYRLRHGPLLLGALSLSLVAALPARAQNAAAIASPRAAPDLDDEDEDETDEGDKAAGDEKADKGVAGLYRKFRALKEKLPFKLGAGFWVYYWQPLAREAALAGGALDPFIEVWAMHLEIDKEWRGLGGHVELRFRDGHRGGDGGGDGFGAASTSNVWFQEVYAYWKPSPLFHLKAGKVYKKNGLTWDNSFFGCLLYYDGFMLNPDWGVSAEGTVTAAKGAFTLEYAVQYLAISDGVQGSYVWGRTTGPSPWTVPGDLRTLRIHSPAPEAEVDSTGSEMTTINNTALARLALGIHSSHFELTLGGAAETASVARYSEADGIDLGGERVTRVEGDLQIGISSGRFGLTLLGEALYQTGVGAREALYGLGGLRLAYDRYSIHCDGSYVRYEIDPRVEEFMIVGGFAIEVGGGLSLYVDYDEWRRRDPRLGADFALYDRSLMVAVDYTY